MIEKGYLQRQLITHASYSPVTPSLCMNGNAPALMKARRLNDSRAGLVVKSVEVAQLSIRTLVSSFGSVSSKHTWFKASLHF